MTRVRYFWLLFAIAAVLPRSAGAQDDTLAVEVAAIRELLSPYAHGRVIVLDPRFASPRDAPPRMTQVERPFARQRALQDSISSLGERDSRDTLHVYASVAVFHDSSATISVTVRHCGRAERRLVFYETVEYALRHDTGRWIVSRRSRLGIS